MSGSPLDRCRYQIGNLGRQDCFLEVLCIARTDAGIYPNTTGSVIFFVLYAANDPKRTLGSEQHLRLLASNLHAGYLSLAETIRGVLEGAMHKRSRTLIFVIDVAFALLVSGLVAMDFVAAEVSATGGNMTQLDVIAGRN
jgi:hypothetical protein